MGSVHALLQLLQIAVRRQRLFGKGVVLPPCPDGRRRGQARRHPLLQLCAVNGQQRLAAGAEDLVCQGQAQHGGACHGAGGNVVVLRDVCVHVQVPFCSSERCFKMSTAFVSAAGIGRPINPAYALLKHGNVQQAVLVLNLPACAPCEPFLQVTSSRNSASSFTSIVLYRSGE